jgi:glyoxylase-like metal-dependent hydrolase (beta-lactamase superfamily II)
MSWFVSREVAASTWLVAEPGHVNSFLVEGSERAAMVDTGLGVAPIRPVAESLTSRPFLVVNTHSHADHVAGNHEFKEIAIHEAGLAVIETIDTLPREALDDYMAFARGLITTTNAYRELDAAFFHLLNRESEPRPFPDGFEPHKWSIRPSRATRILQEGDRIELGDRALSVLYTPGHTPDSICLLEERSGILFAGDMISTGPMYAHMPGSSVDAFAASARRLAELKDEIALVLVGHFGRYLTDGRFLQEVADGFEALLEGDVAFGTDRDVQGALVEAACFSNFSIFVAPDHA